MHFDPITDDMIRYNAATSSFEALVTVHIGSVTRSYACTVPADLTMGMNGARTALKTEALFRHQNAPGLYSSATPQAPVSLRTLRPATPSWLQMFRRNPQARAA